jgi:hypothetical protein
MTKDSQTSPLSEVWAFIAIIGAAIRAPVGAIAMNSNGYDTYANARKTLNL